MVGLEVLGCGGHANARIVIWKFKKGLNIEKYCGAPCQFRVFHHGKYASAVAKVGHFDKQYDK